MNLKFWIVSAMASLVLVACAPGAHTDKSSRAVGADTALGKVLTKTKWCTPASTDGVTSPKFSTLDFSQTGKFVHASYALGDDRSLQLQSKDRGTWALIFDRLYTRAQSTGGAEKELKVTLTAGDADIGSARQKRTRATSTTTGESCIDLTGFGEDAQTFCSCDFVSN